MFLFINFLLTEKTFSSSLEENISLLSPHVQENGRNDNFEFKNDAVIYSKGYYNFTQLGYFSAFSKGHLTTREPFKKRKVKFEITFSLFNDKAFHSQNQRSENIAITNNTGFWISSKIEKGDFFGINKDFLGSGLILNGNKNEPYFQYVDSNKKSSKKIYLDKKKFDLKKPNKLVFTINNKEIEIKLYNFSTQSEMKVYESKSYESSPNYYFGISNDTGGEGTTLKISTITAYQLKTLKKEYAQGEEEKSSKTIFMLGMVSIGVLVYYLYNKQK